MADRTLIPPHQIQKDTVSKEQTQQHSSPDTTANPYHAYSSAETDRMQRAVQHPNAQTLTPNAIMQLQRTYGNRAVLQLLREQTTPAPHPAHHMISRFTTRTATNVNMQDWVGKYQRSSSNGGILQISEQNIVARNDIIESSEEKLAAQNSAVQLVKGEEFTPGYSRVRLKVRDSRVNSLKGDDAVTALGKTVKQGPHDRKYHHMQELIRKVEEQNHMISQGDDQVAAHQESVKNMEAEQQQTLQTGSTDLFITIRDCHMTARLVMGDVGVGRGVPRDETMEVTNAEGGNESIGRNINNRNSKATTANEGAIGVLKMAFSSFETVLTQKGFTEENKGDIIRLLRDVSGTWDYTKGMRLYEMIQADGDVATLFNRTYSINEYAKVAIGQALVVVNDENEKMSADEGNFDNGRELWNYHWAGVILMDGNDYVTLEAVADQNATTLTTDWKFRMYGMIDSSASEEEQTRQKSQTFHGDQKGDTHTGTRPLSMGVKAS